MREFDRLEGIPQGKRDSLRMHIGGVPLLSLCEHETFALLIYCVCSGGTGKPAVVYEGRGVMPDGLFYGSLRASSFESDSVATRVMESR